MSHTYRIVCDHCDHSEEVSSSTAVPDTWGTMSMSFPGVEALMFHVCSMRCARGRIKPDSNAVAELRFHSSFPHDPPDPE